MRQIAVMDVSFMIRLMSVRFFIAFTCRVVFVILNKRLGVSLPAVGSGFTLVVLKMKKPFLKATAAIPNAGRLVDIKNIGKALSFFVILN
jgi:hypothetical protein